MKKKITTLGLTMLMAGTALAGGLLHNTNQHIAFQRMMARGASNEIDAVYTNPAGTAFMDHNGWTLSLNIQSAYQTRDVRATIQTPAGMGLFPGDTYERKYDGNATAPILPSVYGAYKTDRWAVSGFFGVTGGGGKCTFDDGLPMFDAAVMAGLYQQTAGMLQTLATQYPAYAPTIMGIMGGPVTPSDYNIDSYMRGRQYVYGLQLGGAYKFNKHIAGYAGLRLNIFSGNYRGHVNAIASSELLGKMQQLGAAAGAINPALATQLAGMVGENGELVHVAIDCDQSGWGVTPIIGINYKVGGLTLAGKYEFKTNLNIENDTKTLDAPEAFEDAMAGYKHGVNTPSDLPSVLYVAAGYEFIPNKLRGTVEYHYYDDKHADMAKVTDPATGEPIAKNKLLKHGTHEVLAGVEWDINKTFTVSCGFQNTDYGLSDGYQTQTAFSCDSYSIGLGGAVNLSKQVKLNVGYFWTTYSDYTKEMPAAAGGYQGISNALPGKDVYSRTNKVFGVGVDYKF